MPFCLATWSSIVYLVYYSIVCYSIVYYSIVCYIVLYAIVLYTIVWAPLSYQALPSRDSAICSFSPFFLPLLLFFSSLFFLSCSFSPLYSSPLNSSSPPGTPVLDGMIYVRAVRVGRQTYISQVALLVESAQSSKAPIQQFADSVAGLAAISHASVRRSKRMSRNTCCPGV